LYVQIVYVVIGVGLYLLFLDFTESDVLLNFSSGGLEKIVGRLTSDIITYCVLLGYALNLIVTYPMINWGLREVQALPEIFCCMTTWPVLCLSGAVIDSMVQAKDTPGANLEVQWDPLQSEVCIS